VVLSLALGGVAEAQSSCDAKATTAAAKKVAAKLKVIARGQEAGQPPNAKKLARAESDFTERCAKAKSRNDCQAQTSSCAALEATADAAVDVLGGGTGTAAQSRCDAKATKAVAKKVSAKLKVIAKGQQTGQPPNAKKLDKAELEFTDRCNRAKSKNDCQVQTSSCDALEAMADAAIDVLSGGTPPTTTSSTTTSSTTTTSTSTTTTTGLCGNGVIDPGETCDTGIAAGRPGGCPTSCNDGNSCTTDVLQNAGTCTARCVTIPITTCTSGDGCCPMGCTNANDNDCPPAAITLDGTFASHVTTTGTLVVPLVGANAANIDIVLRIFNSTSGSTVTSHLEFCRLNTATTNGNLVLNIPTNITALLVNDQSSAVQNLTVGGTVTLPTFAITVGQNAAGNQVDADVDGNPGVSIPTLLQGSNETLFSSLVIGLSFPSATLADANTISGQLGFTTTGTVFGGSPLNLTGNLSVTPATPTVAFTSARLSGNVPCSQVLTMFP